MENPSCSGDVARWGLLALRTNPLPLYGGGKYWRKPGGAPLEISEINWERVRKGAERGEGRAAAFLYRPGMGKWARIIRMARKPSMPEYLHILQVSAIGAILLGGLGMLIWTGFLYLPDLLQSWLGY